MHQDFIFLLDSGCQDTFTIVQSYYNKMNSDEGLSTLFHKCIPYCSKVMQNTVTDYKYLINTKQLYTMTRISPYLSIFLNSLQKTVNVCNVKISIMFYTIKSLGCNDERTVLEIQTRSKC